MAFRYPLTPSADKRVEAVPAFAAFVDELESRIHKDDPETLWSCQPAFEALVGSRFFTDIVNYELTRMRDDRDRAIEKTRSGAMSIVISDRFSLIARLQTPKPGADNRSLYGLSEHQLIGVLGPGSVELDCHEQLDPYPHEVFDRTKRLVSRGRRVVEPGQVVRMRAPEDVYQIRATTQPSIVLLLSSFTKTRVRWKYDPQTLLPTDAISTDPIAARVEYSIWMMAELGARTSVPTLAKLAEHPDHYVRWAAVRAVMRLDAAEGARLLRGAASDPHPHVRNAALRALAKLLHAGIQLGAAT